MLFCKEPILNSRILEYLNFLTKIVFDYVKDIFLPHEYLSYELYIIFGHLFEKYAGGPTPTDLLRANNMKLKFSIKYSLNIETN